MSERDPMKYAIALRKLAGSAVTKGEAKKFKARKEPWIPVRDRPHDYGLRKPDGSQEFNSKDYSRE